MIEKKSNKEKKASSVALGFFDGVHAGHRAVIGAAVKAAGDELVPAVFTFNLSHNEKAPESKSGFSSIMTEADKEKMIYSLGVKYIFAPDFSDFKDMSGREFFEKILLEEMNAKALSCGEDFRFGKNAECGAGELKKLCEEYSVKLQVIPKVKLNGEDVSSTRIRQAVLNGDMPLAQKLLTKPFTIDFKVISGRKLGRRINAPTINQAFDDGFLIPQFGVYATVTEIDGKFYPSVTNVGVKPTVGSDRVLAETYIIGFDGDLYEKNIPVSFIEKLRGEIKFESIDALKAQIHSDSLKAQKIVGDFIQNTIYNDNTL